MDRFDAQYLSVDGDDVYGSVERESLDLPASLTDLEHQIVLLLYRDFRQTDAAVILGVSRNEVERSMRRIR